MVLTVPYHTCVDCLTVSLSPGPLLAIGLGPKLMDGFIKHSHMDLSSFSGDSVFFVEFLLL